MMQEFAARLNLINMAQNKEINLIFVLFLHCFPKQEPGTEHWDCSHLASS
jgi:hypothetical protein